MENAYCEVRIKAPEGETREKLVARLFGTGFDSFKEEETDLIGYIPSEIYHEKGEMKWLDSVVSGFPYKVIVLEEKNWNQEWEKNYPPVVIAGKCHVRAPFHDTRNDLPFEIVIEPRMAFGTAHHQRQGNN